MLVSNGKTTWAEAIVVLVGLLGAGFLVSWVGTEVLHVSRRAYVIALAVLTVVATGVVAGVTGTSLGEMIGHRWGLGVVGAGVTGLLLGAGMRKKEPATQHLDARELRVAAVWEGVVYGLAEGVLLSALPVFILWQAAATAGWTDAGAWAVGLVASVAMITFHHFGYWDYRGRRVGVVIVGCGVLTLAYLATGSLIAPALGHVVMHVAGITGGVQLPPHARAGVAGVSPSGA